MFGQAVRSGFLAKFIADAFARFLGVSVLTSALKSCIRLFAYSRMQRIELDYNISPEFAVLGSTITLACLSLSRVSPWQKSQVGGLPRCP